ncbi:putative sugar transporter family protein [Diplodia seriata]|uniref:Putative sugar transporter family protein n=1 Tax=Diplodia seriata TaxID=420778 RepID=A0A0G2G7A7_9PEZI|nr:putative sugar transporter family protein [Diplodia seriata]
MADTKADIATTVPVEDLEPTKTVEVLKHDAKLATEKEKNMTLLQGIKLYPKAVAWSVAISTCIVMEGYQTCLLSNFYAFPEFNKKFGEQLPSGEYQVPAAWQAGLSNGVYVGEIIGLMINGWASDKFGYRWTLMMSLFLLTGFIAIFFTAQSVVALQIGEILAGVPWGVFQTLTITYASEVVPVALRGYLTTYVNICWGFGQLIGVGVIKSMLPRNDEWSFRIPYALQWMWPVPLIVIIFFAPESPWWLVRKGRVADAKKSILRLTSLNRDTDFDADETIAMMTHTTALESETTAGATYMDCFKGHDLRRTEIICMYAINVAGTGCAWFLMARGIGRRSLYFWGLVGLCLMLFLMGCLGFVPKAHKDSAALATGAMMICWAMVYQCSVGSVAYSLVSEISSRRLQVKTVVLGRNLYNVVGIICGILSPYMLNPGAWNWGNYTGFFWAGICFCCIIYTYFRLPEPSGRSFAEMDILFEKGVSARKFATTEINVFETTIHSSVVDAYGQQIDPLHHSHEKDEKSGVAYVEKV